MKKFQSGECDCPPVQVAAAAAGPVIGMLNPTMVNAVATAITALFILGKTKLALDEESANQGITNKEVAPAEALSANHIGAKSIPAIGDYYLYNAYLNKDQARQYYNQLHNNYADYDFDSNYDFNTDDDIITTSEKKKHGNLDKSKAKCKDNASTSAASATGMPEPDDQEPEESKDADKKLKKDARKFNLDKDNPTDRKVLDNLDTSVEEFIAKDRKGSIRSEFPGEFLDVSLRKVLEEAKNGNRAARTAYKLLIEKRFLK